MLNSKSIGSKIAEGRKKIRFSQAELAQQVSISPQAVGKWERGESMPDISTLNKLAKIFGVDLNYFSDNQLGENALDKTIEEKMSETEVSLMSKVKTNLGLNWDMGGSEWLDADFSGLKNLKEVLKGSSIVNCKFIESELSDILFSGSEILKCDFSKANFRNSTINGSEVSGNSFAGCSFIDAKFVASEISNCNFSNSDFSGLELTTSEFRKNNIENVIWKFVTFKQTQLTEVVFNGLMENCNFEDCSFKAVKFQDVTLTNTFFKHNRKLNRVEFINCKADKLTYAFLKTGGADMSGLILLS